MNDARIRLLQGISVFGAVSEQALALLLERCNVREVAAGESFFSEGDEGASLLVLESGRVSVRKRIRDREQLIRRLGPGECFGEIALLDNLPRSASVVADEDCTALELRALDLHAVARTDLEQFTIIYMNVARELARRLRHADELLLRARPDSDVPDDIVEVI